MVVHVLSMVAEEINERVLQLCTYGTRMYKGNPDIEVIWAFGRQI